MMLRSFVAITLLAMTVCSHAGQGAHGVWKTESNDAGGYLEVTIGPCEADPDLTCGIITNAFTQDGANPDYENIGKPIVENMKPHGENGYAGGTIWDPEHDKTYKSKMTLKGDDLDVDGCISFVCLGQDWQRVR